MRNRRQASGAFCRRLKAYSKPKPVSPIRKFKESEIWQWAGIVEFIAIVAGFVAVLLTVWHIRIDLQDRQTQRITQAWGLVTQAAAGNSGKGPALEYLNSQEVSLIGINLSAEENQSGVFLSGVNLEGAHLRGADLSGALLEGANLSGANLRRANFSGAYLRQANLSGALLEGANLSGADLRGADLSGALLIGADFSEAVLLIANLSGAVLSKADFSGADLYLADLSEAVLYKADLSGSKDLAQIQLSSACGDEETRLPDGFTIKACLEK